MECIFCEAYFVAESLVDCFSGAAFLVACFRGSAFLCDALDVLVFVRESTFDVLLVAMVRLLSFIVHHYYVTCT